MKRKRKLRMKRRRDWNNPYTLYIWKEQLKGVISRKQWQSQPILRILK